MHAQCSFALLFNSWAFVVGLLNINWAFCEEKMSIIGMQQIDWLVPNNHERKCVYKSNKMVKNQKKENAKRMTHDKRFWLTTLLLYSLRHRPYLKITMYYIVCHYHFLALFLSLSRFSFSSRIISLRLIWKV